MAPVYVQYGCGFSFGEGWLNFDSSPTLRIERLPVVGKALGLLAGNSQRFPRQVSCGDIVKGISVPANSVRGVYASHVLEHLALEDFRKALRNTFEMLEPDGVFRLIVPDLEERARRYVRQVSIRVADSSGDFMRTCHLGQERRPRTLLSRMRWLIGGSMHLWMWDEPSITEELRKVGFIEIRRCRFGDADDAMFARVEDRGRFVDPTLDLPELAIEARKPQRA
ncbi:MAG: methyltransferase domain-containing protein [Hyphomicrobiaceae bacterium]|nr:methyltransferase domain-containing protein [Hyphomicrobiaceae bacterium]